MNIDITMLPIFTCLKETIPSIKFSSRLFLKVWRNKYLNSIIWKFVKANCKSYENIGLLSAGYNEIYDTRSVITLNAFQVLKEKVYRNEYINLPIKLKSDFFYYTKEFDQEFWKLFIGNYKSQLLYQRKLFQYIICGNNINALHVFLNYPSSICKDKLPKRTLQQIDNGSIELPCYEFPRHKSQLSDRALKVGYLTILKCLSDNNEKSISIGQSLFQNILNISGRTDYRNIDKEFKSNKQITSIFNYCLDNNFFTLQDFNGTIINVDFLFSQNHSIEALEFINSIKEHIKFDKSKSMNQFLTIDLFEISFRKVLLYLNFYNYLNSLPIVQSSTSPPLPPLPFIELKYSNFNINQPELLIKECMDKSISIPLILKFIEFALRDFPHSKSFGMVSFYMAYCDQFEQATKLLKGIGLNQQSLFEYSYRFCDLQAIKSVYHIGTFNYDLFSNNQNATIQQKIEFLNHLLNCSPMVISNQFWFSLYERLLISNQLELVQHLLTNHNHYFVKLSNESSYKKFATIKMVLVNGFDSFKLIFRYLVKYTKQMLYCLLGSIGEVSDENSFMVIDWLIQQNNEETGEYYIKRSDPGYIDTLNVNLNSDNIEKLEYLTKNGFACTCTGIYTKVFTFQRFNMFKYLFENRKESIDASESLLLNDWFQVISYLEQTFGSDSVGEYSNRFPLTSYPIVTPEKLFEYYLVSKQMDKFLQHLDSTLLKLSGNGINDDDYDGGVGIYSIWNTACELIELASVEFVNDIITVLLNHLSFDVDSGNILKLSKFINPLLSSLTKDLNLPAIKFIFNKWPIIIKPEHDKTFNHSSFKVCATETFSIELFNYFASIGLPPTEIQEDKPFKLDVDFKGLFYYFYCFQNFKYSISIKKEKKSLEIWKIHHFFKFILKNPNSHDNDEDSSCGSSSSISNYDDDSGSNGD